jgi:hypothetical protein
VQNLMEGLMLFILTRTASSGMLPFLIQDYIGIILFIFLNILRDYLVIFVLPKGS